MIIILMIWNIIVFLLYGYDKRKAIKHKHRISENTLLTCALLFGSVGALLGMYFFHHKTLKWKFKIIVPLLLIIQISSIIYFDLLNI